MMLYFLFIPHYSNAHTILPKWSSVGQKMEQNGGNLWVVEQRRIEKKTEQSLGRPSHIIRGDKCDGRIKNNLPILDMESH